VKGEGIKGRRWTMMGLLVALIGYWGPWVAHKAAALNVNGPDLAEFVRLLPEVQSGAERMVSELFYLPLLAAALSLALLAPAHTGWLKGLMLTVAMALALILLPPYPYTVARLLSREFRWRFAFSLLSAGGIVAYPGLKRLPQAWREATTAGLCLAAAILPLTQFLSVKDALDRLYGHPIAVGWGAWLTTVGFLLAATAALCPRK